jgi:fatty-acid desaturase
MQLHNPRNSEQFSNCGRRMHSLRDPPKKFLIINHGGPIIWFHIFGELNALGNSRSHTLGYVIIGSSVIHRNYVINSYGHMAGSQNLAQRNYSWIQCEPII